MCKVQMLRALVEQRLTAAAEEIFGLFERTIAEYEEELCRSKEENERQRELLDAVFNPQLRVHRAGVEQLLVVKEEVAPEQQECSSSVDQKEPEPPQHIKEEQEEMWSSQEGEQLEGLEEADITKFPFTPVLLKSEDDEEKDVEQLSVVKAQSSQEGEQLQGLEEADITKVPFTPVPVKSEDDEEEGFVPPEQQECSSSVDLQEPEPPQNIKEEQEELWISQEGEQLQGLEEADITKFPFTPVPVKSEDDEEEGQSSQLHRRHTPFSYSEFVYTGSGTLKRDTRTHTREKPFTCSVCKNSFTQRRSLQSHMRIHTGEKRFSCNVCDKKFTRSTNFKIHRCVRYMGPDITKFPFTPVPVKSKDGEEEAQSSQLHQRPTQHMETEADGEDCGGPEPARNSHPHPFLQPETEDKTSDFSEPRQLSSFAVSSQCFQQRNESREPQSGLNFRKKNRYRFRPKLFRCSECGKNFNQNSNLKTHMRTHTGEKPFTCPFCGKGFGQKAHLQNHLKCHTGEKPYRCSVCGRRFSRFEHMKLHMRTHTGERPCSCTSCGKRLHQYKTHMCGAESSRLQEEPWSSQEGEQLQGLEEADITKFPFTPVPGKSEDDEEEAQSSQLHQRQSHPDSFNSHRLECNPFIGQFW